MKSIPPRHKPLMVFLLFLALYFLMVISLSPWGDFPVNDDWDSQLQILAFERGDYRIHAAIDAAFVLQPWIGYVWAQVFGPSFTSLRILTLLFSVLLAGVLLKVLYSNRHAHRESLIVLLLFMLHPVILASSLTFMTEIYFLFLILTSYFYFDKYFKKGGVQNLFLGALACGLSVLIRQFGIISLIAVILSGLFNKIFQNNKNTLKPFDFKKTALVLLVSGLFVYIWQIYPRAGEVDTLGKALLRPEELKTRLLYMTFVFPFLGFAISPLFFRFDLKKLNLQTLRKHAFTATTVTLLISGLTCLIFLLDVQPLGNVFYLENLYGRTRYRPNFTLFDNIYFKLLVSFVISTSLVFFVLELLRSIRKQIKNSTLHTDVFTLLCIVGYYLVLLFPSDDDIYDRYALPFLLFCVIYAFKHLKIRFSRFALVLVILISFVLNYEFYTSQEILHSQTKQIIARTGLIREVYSIDTYALYEDALRRDDLLGEKKKQNLGRNFSCHVQQYYLPDESSKVNFLREHLEDLQNKLITNPQMYDRRRKEDVRNIKKSLDKLAYNEEYLSFLYNPVGKKAFVGAFCVDGVLEPL